MKWYVSLPLSWLAASVWWWGVRVLAWLSPVLDLWVWGDGHLVFFLCRSSASVVAFGVVWCTDAALYGLIDGIWELGRTVQGHCVFDVWPLVSLGHSPRGRCGVQGGRGHLPFGCYVAF